MIISTIEELRLYIPNTAQDSIEPMAGFIDNSEHDVLIEKIGYELYVKLVEHYADTDVDDLLQAVSSNTVTDYYDKLLLMSQRIVAFDAMSRAVGVQTISLNNAGINIQSADDYGKVSKDELESFRSSCVKEMHASVNRLLQTLEEWSATATTDTDLTEIKTLWKKSRYYYLAAGMLIPSAMVLQEYLNFYENREKYIQMLPDLRYIQEDIIGDIIGEELTDWFSGIVISGTTDKPTLRCLHKLRKAMAAHLESRTQVLNVPSSRRQRAHEEAMAMMESAREYIEVHQGDLPSSAATALSKSPLYKSSTAPATQNPRAFENNRKGNVIFVMPGMN